MLLKEYILWCVLVRFRCSFFPEIWIYTKSRRLYYALFQFLNNIVLGAPRK